MDHLLAVCGDKHLLDGKQIVKFVIGLAVLLAFRFGLKAIFPELPVFDLIRYAAMGVWASLGAPWVFVQTKLAVSVGSKQ